MEKAKANIGEVREWKSGKFRKIADGSWERVDTGKVVSASTMKKQLKEEFNEAESNRSKRVREIKDEVGYRDNLTAFQRVKLEHTVSEKMAGDEYMHSLRSLMKDLSEEIDEIDNRIKSEAKRRKEKKTGKKEFSLEMVDKLRRSVIKNIVELDNRVPVYVTADKAFGDKVTCDDYYLDTEAYFDRLDTDNIGGSWNEMKKIDGLIHKTSPNQAPNIY